MIGYIIIIAIVVFVTAMVIICCKTFLILTKVIEESISFEDED